MIIAVVLSYPQSSICLERNIFITNISLYLASGPPGEGLLVVEDEHVPAADLLEDGLVSHT